MLTNAYPFNLNAPRFVPSYEPAYFSLQDLRDEDEQDAPLLQLSEQILETIMEYVPLKDRLLKVRPVCRKFSEAVKKSVKSVEFLRDELDYCDDAKIAFFLSVYGKHIEHLNYDLFRSCSLREYTQWSWRQSVISSVTKCTALKQLDVLICCRHRLRDGDLAVIFKHCQKLEVLRMDATFLNGNCFAKAPVTLKKVELDCCKNFAKKAFISMCVRLVNLETLHVSLLTCLDQPVIKRIADLKNLKDLSLVADPAEESWQYRISEVRRLPKLKTLCVDGLNPVNDKFLGELCDPKINKSFFTLKHLSLAYCQNIGPKGIAKLAALPNLRSLNLDGVNKRDISEGVQTLIRVGTLQRMFVADDTWIDVGTATEIAVCPSIRTMDMSANTRFSKSGFPTAVYENRISMRYVEYGLVDEMREFLDEFTSIPKKPLKILTDNVEEWSRFSAYTRYDVELVYTGALTPNMTLPPAFDPKRTVANLPRGYLCPGLRRGTRYKMLNLNLNKSIEEIDPNKDQENKPAVQLLQLPENIENIENFELVSAVIEKQNTEILRLISEIYGVQRPVKEMFNMDMDDFPPMASAPGFTHTDFEDSITVGSAGAPGPPADKFSDKILKHCRPSRPKRQAQKEKEALRRSSGGSTNNATSPVPAGPEFTDDDFPPLG